MAGGFRNLDPLRARLNALYTTGRARLLSNPRTTVISGRTATFQVGGQVPVPSLSSATATGTTTGITFKDFGILLDVTANANADGIVTMRVRAEVSAPDFSTGVTPPGGGSPIPGFTRRSTVTEVTTRPNGTLALSGLVSSDVTANITKISDSEQNSDSGQTVPIEIVSAQRKRAGDFRAPDGDFGNVGSGRECLQRRGRFGQHVQYRHRAGQSGHHDFQ